MVEGMEMEIIMNIEWRGCRMGDKVDNRNEKTFYRQPPELDGPWDGQTTEKVATQKMTFPALVINDFLCLKLI